MPVDSSAITGVAQLMHILRYQLPAITGFKVCQFVGYNVEKKAYFLKALTCTFRWRLYAQKARLANVQVHHM